MYLPNYNVVKTKKKQVITKNLSEFETFEAEQPIMPDFSCPNIDNIVDLIQKANSELENVRTINSQLRDNAEYWKKCCEEMQEKINNYEDWKENLKKTISQDI